MYEELMKRLREVSGDAQGMLSWKAADAIEERDRYALSLQHEMMAEAESHMALVERLNKQIEELRKPRWIPVTERLPEIHEEVLVCNEDYGETGLGFSEVAVWDGSDWICTWDMESRLHCITHWMPLPEPPKEEA